MAKKKKKRKLHPQHRQQLLNELIKDQQKDDSINSITLHRPQTNHKGIDHNKWANLKKQVKGRL